jgi:uncharacterized protein (TIGR03435 family)
MTRLTTLTLALLLTSAPHARLGAQSEAPVKTFEVATVKINKSGNLQTQFDILPGSGRVGVTNMQLRGLIQSAYRVPANQLVNVPAWVNGTRVDIIAKADPSASIQELQTMLQPLLVERFKLAFHRETRELDVLALTVESRDGTLGPKLKRSAGDCEALGAQPRNTLTAPAPGQRPACGIVPSGPGRLVANGLDMRAITALLSLASQGRQVVDQTGLTGGLDIDLTYTPDALSAAALALRQTAPPPQAALVDPNGPPLSTALRDQLGLKLEAKKLPLEVMVVDRIEPPTED